jgi:IclR helix-turn-helix domain
MSADGRAEESPQQGIQSIEVGAQVLRALEVGRGPMVLSEVARNCVMHPAKVHRYLVSLVRAGLASQDAHRPVRPGAGRPSPWHGGAAPDGGRKYRRCLYLTAEGSERPCHHRGGVDRGRTGHRPLGLGNPRGAGRLADALRSTAGQISAELGYTARRNAPAPTRSQRWRR